MNTFTSLQLRPVVAELDAARVDAGKALGDAEHAHRLATRRAVLAGAYDGCDQQTAVAVDERRRAYEQARIAHEEAAVLLAEAVRREREEGEEAARAAIRAGLEAMDALAASADEDFASLIGKVRRLRSMEVELHKQARADLGRTPWAAPQAFAALRGVANFAATLANSGGFDTLTVEPVVSKAAAGARHNIEGALS